MTRPTLATVSLGGCEGCHVALLDAHEGLFDLVEAVDLVNTPYSGPAELPDHVDIVLVEGAVTTDADREHLLAARAAAGTLVAIGSCAVLGGIGGLRNLLRTEDVLAAAFPGDGHKAAHLPGIKRQVQRVADVVEVDASLPGCAPTTEHLVGAVFSLARGEEYELPRRNLCEECHRVKDVLLSHSSEFVSDSVYALMELDTIDPDRCFLEQGLLCMGPMTREGCGARCTAANVPCRGCSGPSRTDFEQGGKAVDALASVLPAGALMYMEDLIGTASRFSVAASVLPGLAGEKGGDDDE